MTGRTSTRSPFDTSRFVFEEPSKRSSGGGKNVHFEAGEASFSEQMTSNTRLQRRHAAPRHSTRQTVTTTPLIVASLLMLMAVIAYRPSLESFDFSRIASRYAKATLPMFAGTWNLGRGHSESVAIQSVTREAALLARWGVLRPDYALWANGGRVVPGLTSSRQEPARTRSTIAAVDPEVIIDEDLTIGRCWSTVVTGQVGLSMPTPLYPHLVTIDHIPRQISLDIGRAPRRMILWGVVDGLSNARRFKALTETMLDIDHLASFDLKPPGRTAPPLRGSNAFVALAAIEYDIGGDSPTQTFAIFDHVRDSRMDFGIFVLEVVDNWGGADTCLYRVRIHGEPVGIASN